MRIPALLLLLLALLVLPHPARAAESYANCTGVVSKLPASISKSGTWCLEQSLTTSIATGNAITIGTDNVTLDCNDFVVSDIAGSATTAVGIHLQNHLNATIRHCKVQGFRLGAYLQNGGGGGGHLIEDNRFDGNWWKGIWIEGDGSVVRRNQIVNTGGSTNVQTGLPMVGIYGVGAIDYVDNTISGVAATTGTSRSVYGIYAYNSPAGVIEFNRISGLASQGTGKDYGIYSSAENSKLVIWKNNLSGDTSAGSVGLKCFDATARAKENIITGFKTGIGVCGKGTGNDVSP